MAHADALDTTISVLTPENIAFDYQLAGPFRRLPAYVIDVFARIAILGMILLLIWLTTGLAIGFSGATFLGSFGVAVTLVVIFVINQFYGTLLETYWNGRTIGKRLMGIRVIDVEGSPINLRRAFLRNLVRIADLMPWVPMTAGLVSVPFFGSITVSSIGLVSMLLTRRMQRLGDLAAGTMVIVDERSWRHPIAKVDDRRVPALASFIPGDYRVSRSMAKTLGIYAERRHYLSPPRRREICLHLVRPLLERFEFRSDIDPDLLMYALYYKAFLAEPDETPDLGALAGFSPLRKQASSPKARVESTGVGRGVEDGSGSTEPTPVAALPVSPEGSTRGAEA